MFNGRVRLNLPNKATINEDATVYTLYPLEINSLPVITKNLGDKFTPLQQYSVEPGPYIDENSTVTIADNNVFELSIEAFNEIDVQNGIVVSGSGAQNLTYTWRRNGTAIVSNNRRTVDKNKLTINSTNYTDSGTYTVEVQNDVGITISDYVTLDVISITQVDGFYKNIIKNYDASQNNNHWTEVSTQGNQVITKKFINNLSKSTLSSDSTKNANFVGYAYPDHFNRSDTEDTAYQYNSEAAANTPFVSRVNNFTVLGSLSYFTRSPYLSYLREGSSRVQYYQDIDLIDFIRYINGTIGGVTGLQANFSCFIGNSISYFKPKKNLQKRAIGGRIKTDQWCFEQDMPKPRLDIGNKSYTTPTSEDYTTVYIEEYDGANLVKIHEPLNDPYRTTYKKQVITPTDGISPSFESGYLEYKNEEGPDSIGNNLFDFFKDINQQPVSNLGQWIALRKLNDLKLDSRTNKIRVRIEFFNTGLQQGEGDSPTDLVQKFRTDGIYLIPSYLRDDTPDKKFMVNSYTFGKKGLNPTSSLKEVLPMYNQPRNFITGLNLYVQPILEPMGVVKDAALTLDVKLQSEKSQR